MLLLQRSSFLADSISVASQSDGPSMDVSRVRPAIVRG